ncbi:hypothetical protein GV794_18210 [Nocardia cyriacigeorgica]|uniref:Uncharacterized protein n=1 Tax=Nocardia cyriacigeorgica TaxID=135487 RepID=A0A6P1DHX1_9NOCA|nr:hypothetical protein [Nocardia cyriacigeorgica]NEW41904.1 hypothetical protein [Nocardia cyriacigeorgica]NEW48230.1 hypothetical protein [Nocardia cyriacigeorgica]NEW52267.1 hypothetical protein [Nocardia cyriacigeorgica]NEW57575.1 hypothetical protein [Nocardia cyriacigeorgica]
MTAAQPSYYQYFDRPIKVETTPNGRDIGSILNNRTGRFESAPFEITEAVLGVRTESHIRKFRSEREFIRATEEARMENLRGSGPIFALYETITAIFDQRRAEKRHLTPEERALVASLFQRTYTMWADEFARRDSGQQPSFDYESTLPPTKE